uniref:Glycine rich superfamily member n=1 Tax=Rhipicephalus zambeziensis TaxID=60191 RepID=A0A224Y6A1_9ACAR
MKVVILALLIAASCTADLNEHDFSGCSDERQPNGNSLLDQALEKYISSGLIKNVSIPDFNETVNLGRKKYHLEFYNVAILGLHSVQIMGCNYFEARWNKRMQIRVALQVQGLKATVSLRHKNRARYSKVTISISLPELLFVTEISETQELLKLAQFDVTGIEKLKIKFTFLTGVLRALNKMHKLQECINKKVNQKLLGELPKAVEGILRELGQRHTGDIAQCTDCTTFDVYLRNALTKFRLDPTPLPKITQDLFARLAQVQVINATIRGLSKLRQSGDIVLRIDHKGARAHVDVTFRKLSVTFHINFTTLVADYTAIVSVTISARTILEVVERNKILILEKLYIATEEVDVNVTPIGTVSSVITFFLPPKFLAEMVKRNIQQLTNSTTQGGFDALRTFAQGGASAS